MKNEIVIILEGGLVQCVLSNKAANVRVIDYDCEGASDEEIAQIPQDGSDNTASAYLHELDAVVNPLRVKELMKVEIAQ